MTRYFEKLLTRRSLKHAFGRSSLLNTFTRDEIICRLSHEAFRWTHA